MEPRSSDRGNIGEHAPHVRQIAPQWSRDRQIAEMRPNQLPPPGNWTLQWSRDRQIAEIPDTRLDAELARLPAMEPRSSDRGNALRGPAECRLQPPSMEPRSSDRGNAASSPRSDREYRPSMEPRSSDRGNDGAIEEAGPAGDPSMEPRSSDRGNSDRKSILFSMTRPAVCERPGYSRPAASNPTKGAART